LLRTMPSIMARVTNVMNVVGIVVIFDISLDRCCDVAYAYLVADVNVPL
jgi:hypothetical protein